ncbi:MAG: AAA family ATPase [Sphingobium sp.]
MTRRLRVIVLHGVESTGKSGLADSLAAHYATIAVPEYGRVHAEMHGVDMDEADLLHIGAVQTGAIEAAKRITRDLVIADTDALMTAAWAQMMIGYMPDPLLTGPKADLYLLMAPDMPWVPDNVRIYGDPAVRRRFADICRAVLDRAGVAYKDIGGGWDARFASAVAAIDALMAHPASQPFDLDAQSE